MSLRPVSDEPVAALPRRRIFRADGFSDGKGAAKHAARNLAMLSIVAVRRVNTACHRDKPPYSAPREQRRGEVIRNKRRDSEHHRRKAYAPAMSKRERDDESQSGEHDERPHRSIARSPP